jgi:hypothetical protein
MTRLHAPIDLATSIALLSLVVSAITLFFTQLRGADLHHVIGPEFKVYYPADGGFALYLPATFLNKSSQTGTILKCGVTLFNSANPEGRYYMEWRSFSRLDPASQNWLYEEMAHAIAIGGHESTTKIIWFSWRASSTPLLHLTEGQYVLSFHYWTMLNGKPGTSQHGFYIDEPTRIELDQYLANKRNTVVDIVLDKQIPSNKIMTSFESKSLLGL